METATVYPDRAEPGRSRPQHTPEQNQAAHHEDSAPRAGCCSGTSGQTPIWTVRPSLRRELRYRLALLRVWSQHFCIHLRRIFSLDEARASLRGVDHHGPLSRKGPAGCRYLNRQTLASMRDMRPLVLRFGKDLTFSDLQQFADGWLKGAEWGRNPSGNKNYGKH